MTTQEYSNKTIILLWRLNHFLFDIKKERINAFCALHFTSQRVSNIGKDISVLILLRHHHYSSSCLELLKFQWRHITQPITCKLNATLPAGWRESECLSISSWHEKLLPDIVQNNLLNFGRYFYHLPCKYIS